MNAKDSAKLKRLQAQTKSQLAKLETPVDSVLTKLVKSEYTVPILAVLVILLIVVILLT